MPDAPQQPADFRAWFEFDSFDNVNPITRGTDTHESNEQTTELIQNANHHNTHQVINIYYDEALGGQVCTCCRNCKGWRYVPGAQIFAKCAVGDASSTLVRLTSKATHQKRGVAQGKVVRYEATVKNLDKKAALEGLALTVQLPAAGATYRGRAKTSASYRVTSPKGRGGKIAYRKAKGLAAVLNDPSTPPTVTWRDLVLPPRKAMQFSLAVRVNTQEVYHGMPLTFSASVYQELPVNGLPYCARAINQTVLVK